MALNRTIQVNASKLYIRWWDIERKVWIVNGWPCWMTQDEAELILTQLDTADSFPYVYERMDGTWEQPRIIPLENVTILRRKA